MPSLCRDLSIVVAVLALWRPAFGATEAMFRGDPQHTGVYQSSAAIDVQTVKWKFHTGGPIVSSPAVLQGTVFVGSEDGALYAIHRDTGKLLWKFETKSRVASSPAVANGMVYFTSYDGRLYAVDAQSGALRWSFQTGGERRYEGTHLHGSQPAAETMPDIFDVYLSSPTVWNGSVFFGSGDANVYALNAASGALEWKFKTGDVVHASPAIADGTLFIGSWDSYFYALNATTGKEKWRFGTGQDPLIHNQVGIQSSAAVAGGKVYFGCRDSHLYALEAATGKLIWAFPTHGSWVVGSPAVDAGKVYFATSDSSLFYALEVEHGTADFSLTFQGWPLFASPAIAGDRAYIGTWAGKLMAIDLNQGRVAATFLTDGARKNGASLTKADGSPDYAAAYRSDFYDDLVAGYEKMMTAGAILSSPVVEGDVVYVGSMDGNLYALG